MDTTLLETACLASGMLPSAIEDGLRRLHEHFAAQADPTPERISQQLTRLRETAPHLFTPPAAGTTAAAVAAHYGVPHAVWEKMSPADRMSYARRDQPPAVRQKPGRFAATPEQLKQLDGKSPTEKRTQAYLWQREAEKGGHHG